MQNLDIKDNLDIINDKDFSNVISNNEKIQWSGKVLKINRQGKIQIRYLVITNNKILNIGKRGNFIENIFSKLVKRIILIEDIEAISFSKYSNNFLLHIKNDYDFNLNSFDKSDVILRILKYKFSKKKLKFFFVDDMDLLKYAKKDNEFEKEFPDEFPEYLNLEDFLFFIKKEKENRKNTEIILSTDDSFINQDSFKIIKKIGTGFSGNVFLAEKNSNKKLYALKVLKKLDIIKNKLIKNLQNEKKILEKVNNPFIVNLDYCYTSKHNIYFAMEFKQGGELLTHLHKKTRFNEKTTKFYACQIIIGLTYLHSLNIIYRDMKPENILMDSYGNLSLADFGISKILDQKDSTKTFVGTPFYIAPEIIKREKHNKMVDIWTFGILLYEMVFGIPPFNSCINKILCNSIINLDPIFPVNIDISQNFIDLIKSCLVKDPKKRIGFFDTKDIMKHEWFCDIDWSKVRSKSYTPPIVPEIKDKFDLRYFCKEIIKSVSEISEDFKEGEKKLVDKYQDVFELF